MEVSSWRFVSTKHKDTWQLYWCPSIVVNSFLQIKRGRTYHSFLFFSPFFFSTSCWILNPDFSLALVAGPLVWVMSEFCLALYSQLWKYRYVGWIWSLVTITKCKGMWIYFVVVKLKNNKWRELFVNICFREQLWTASTGTLKNA